MSVTTTVQRLSENAVEAVGAPSVAGVNLYQYFNGALVAVTPITRRVFTVQPGQAAQIEFLDTAAAPDEAYPQELYFQWTAVLHATTYLVQELTGVDPEDDDDWTTIRAIVSAGEEIFSHLSRVLVDGQAYSFRVLPVSADNIQGDALQFDVTMVCWPKRPVVVVTFDEGTGTIELAAVA